MEINKHPFVFKCIGFYIKNKDLILDLNNLNENGLLNDFIDFDLINGDFAIMYFKDDNYELFKDGNYDLFIEENKDNLTELNIKPWVFVRKTYDKDSQVDDFIDKLDIDDEEIIDIIITAIDDEETIYCKMYVELFNN